MWVSLAPRRCSSACRLSSRATATTCAPERAASWMANRPTALVAPTMRIRRPRIDPSRRTASNALVAGTGRVARCSQEASEGAAAVAASGTARCCAHPWAASPRKRTRSPCWGPRSSAADRRTVPLPSHPGIVPAGAPARAAMSPGLGAKASTRTRSSPSDGSGSGASASVSPPGAPGSVVHASIVKPA